MYSESNAATLKIIENSWRLKYEIAKSNVCVMCGSLLLAFWISAAFSPITGINRIEKCWTISR